MKTHNFDYAYIGLTSARIGSQLKTDFKLELTCSFRMDPSDGYTFVSLHQVSDLTCIKSFFLANFDSPQSFMDAVFAYCLENDLFKQPLDIKLVD